MKRIAIIVTAVVVISLVVTVAVALLLRKPVVKTQVTINNQTFQVEVADTREERARGLSGRKKLGEKKSMLFVFEEAGFHTFWMKDMEFNLDIIFIKDDKIVTIYKNIEQPGKDISGLEQYRSKEPVNLVLEVNSGLSDKYDFKEGDSVKIENIGN